MPFISEQLAKTALEFSFEDISEKAVLEAKRCIIDTLACAVGGAAGESSRIVTQWAIQQGGIPESTIFGSGKKIPAANASLANATMARYLDLMDTYIRATSVGNERISAIHACENIPAIMAVGEKVKATGKQILASTVLAYELCTRFCDSVHSASITEKGFHHSTLGYFLVPAIVGPMMGLTSDQIAAAIGTGGTMVTLGILDSMPVEPNTMAKNTAYPLATMVGITAALWAQNGFQGPRSVFEGQKGLGYSVLGKDYDLEGFARSLSLPWERFAILETRRKMFCSDSTTQGSVEAVYRLVLEHDLKPEDIEEVHIQAGIRAVAHTSDPNRFYLLNKETADHSIPFVAACLILFRRCGLEEFRDAIIGDPRVAQMVEKVTFEPDPAMDQQVSSGRVQIRCSDGRQLQKEIIYHRGDPHNPMNDDEIHDKFRRFAGYYMDKEQMERCINIVYNLEKEKNIDNLMSCLRFSI